MHLIHSKSGGVAIDHMRFIDSLIGYARTGARSIRFGASDSRIGSWHRKRIDGRTNTDKRGFDYACS